MRRLTPCSVVSESHRAEGLLRGWLSGLRFPDCVQHGQRIARFDDVVHAHEQRTALRGEQRRRRGTHGALLHRPAGHGADHALAREAGEHGHAELDEARHAAQQFQVVLVALAEAEANVASLRARVSEYENRVQSLSAASRMLPQIEAEYTQLNRDYDVNKRNYDQLVARRESATMAVEMGATSGVADFRLIDPPTVPNKPAAPNRLLLMPAAGLAALMMGAAISFLISQIRPTFSDTNVLRDVTGLAVLGAVSMIADPDRARNQRRGKIAFLGGVGALVGLFGAMTVWLMLARMA